MGAIAVRVGIAQGALIERRADRVVRVRHRNRVDEVAGRRVGLGSADLGDLETRHLAGFHRRRVGVFEGLRLTGRRRAFAGQRSRVGLTEQKRLVAGQDLGLEDHSVWVVADRDRVRQDRRVGIGQLTIGQITRRFRDVAELDLGGGRIGPADAAFDRAVVKAQVVPGGTTVAGNLLVDLDIHVTGVFVAAGDRLVGTADVAGHRRAVGLELALAGDGLRLTRKQRPDRRVTARSRRVGHLAVVQRRAVGVGRVGHRDGVDEETTRRVDLRRALLDHLESHVLAGLDLGRVLVLDDVGLTRPPQALAAQRRRVGLAGQEGRIAGQDAGLEDDAVRARAHRDRTRQNRRVGVGQLTVDQVADRIRDVAELHLGFGRIGPTGATFDHPIVKADVVPGDAAVAGNLLVDLEVALAFRLVGTADRLGGPGDGAGHRRLVDVELALAGQRLGLARSQRGDRRVAARSRGVDHLAVHQVRFAGVRRRHRVDVETGRRIDGRGALLDDLEIGRLAVDVGAVGVLDRLALVWPRQALARQRRRVRLLPARLALVA